MVDVGLCMWGCGAASNSKEHITPDWIGNVLKELVPEGVKLHRAISRHWDAPPATPQHIHHGIGKPSGPKRKIVCDTCNKWMGRLDLRAERAMRELMLGQVPHAGKRLPGGELLTISTWITRMVLVFDYLQQRPAATQKMRKRFHDERRPFDGSRVVLASHVPEQSSDAGELAQDWPNRLSKDGREEFICHTFCYGYLVLQVLIDVGREGTVLPPTYGYPNEFLIPIWPLAESRQWPPDYAMRSDLLDVFGTKPTGPLNAP
jgi:hypothetical protein